MRRLVLCLMAVLASGALVKVGRAAVYTDDFATSRDFYTMSVGDWGIWDGLLYDVPMAGNVAVAHADSNITTTGRLTLESSGGHWESMPAHDSGLLLYKTITGDFVAEVQVTSFTVVANNDMGLMARVADLNSAGAGEDWVAVRDSQTAAPGLNAAISIDDDVETFSTSDASPAWHYLQLERQGDVFTARRRANTTDAWTEIGQWSRADMQGLALQVGIYQATSSGASGQATFANFKLTTPDPAIPGTLKWQVGTGGWVASSPAVADDGTIYFGSADGYVYAVDPDGAIKWQYPTGGAVLCSPAIAADGTVYVGSNDGNIYALNSDGSLLWQFAAADVIVSCPAVLPGGGLCVGDAGGVLYAINSGGSVRWQLTLGPGLTSPAIGGTAAS